LDTGPTQYAVKAAPPGCCNRCSWPLEHDGDSPAPSVETRFAGQTARARGSLHCAATRREEELLLFKSPLCVPCCDAFEYFVDNVRPALETGASGRPTRRAHWNAIAVANQLAAQTAAASQTGSSRVATASPALRDVHNHDDDEAIDPELVSKTGEPPEIDQADVEASRVFSAEDEAADAAAYRNNLEAAAADIGN
jgi:hypothetical protein